MRPSHHDPSTCDQALEWLALDLGDDATPEERQRLRHHLERCEDCRSEAEALGESRRVFVEYAPAPPTDDEVATLRAAVAKRVAHERPETRQGPGATTLRWLALAAALWLAVTLALRWSAPPEPLGEGPIDARHGTPTPPSVDRPGDRSGGDLPEIAPTDEPSPTRVASRDSAPSEATSQDPAPETVASQPVPPQGPRQTETSQAETLQAETLQAETLQAETLQAETLQAETLQAERPRIATASLPAGVPRTAAPFTLKLVSDKPDLVIYWLVDPADNHPHQENPDATAL